jgi:hypothetical protein
VPSAPSSEPRAVPPHVGQPIATAQSVGARWGKRTMMRPGASTKYLASTCVAALAAVPLTAGRVETAGAKPTPVVAALDTLAATGTAPSGLGEAWP